MRVWIKDWVKNLKKKIQEQLGIPANLQNLIYLGKSLQEDTKM